MLARAVVEGCAIVIHVRPSAEEPTQVVLAATHANLPCCHMPPMQAHAQASSAASLFTGQAEAIKQQLEAFMSEEHRWPQQLLHKVHGRVSGEEAAEALRQLSHSAGVPLVGAAMEAAEKLALQVGGMRRVCGCTRTC